MLLHILAHIDAGDRLIIIEKKFSEGFGEFGFAHACWAQEHERADGAGRVFEPGARASDRVGDRGDGFFLTHDALAENVFHAEEFFALALHHFLNRDTCPARDDRRDDFRGHGLGREGLRVLVFNIAHLFFERRNIDMLQPSSGFIIAATGGVFEIKAGLIELFFEIGG